MAIKHINPKAKEESGVIVSGKDAKKVAKFLVDKHLTKEQFLKSSNSLELSLKTIKTIYKSKNIKFKG